MNATNRHNHAMDLAEKAFRLVSKEPNRANDLFKKAYEIERSIALQIAPTKENDPSRSILFRSATSLALNAKLFRESERMVAYGLIGFPPEEIAEELREVFEQVRLQRRKLRRA